MSISTDRSRFIRQNPLVLASVMLLLGVAVGGWSGAGAGGAVAASAVAWGVWVLAEALARKVPTRAAATGALCMSILFAGMTLWKLNQHYGENSHLLRLAPESGEVPVTVRLRVVVPPEAGGDHHGNLYWTAEATELFSEQGWIPAAGTAQVKWRANAFSPSLHTGDVVEAYGWLRRPEGAINPGGLDVRRRLAADRIFVLIRVPRPSGVIVLSAGRETDGGAGVLARMRLLLRRKLLEHTTRVDVDAANTMVALVLGYRDPSMEEISRAFADAGVAHLLAISGAHVGFLAVVAWGLLRLVPMRPQWREPLVAGLLLLYVVATPCGPPVVRAAIVLAMVMISRMLGRPRAYMNMLAAAVIIIVLVRPTDASDAGFQLTFACTAALLLLAERLHGALFGRYLERQKLIVDLSESRAVRLRLDVLRFVLLASVANILGTITAAPLVMFHFNQVSLYGVLTGLIEFPIVAVTMLMALIQLALEAVSGVAAAWFAPFSTDVARFMVWSVEALASLPGAAVGVRTPPVWLVLLMFVPLVLWAMRARFGIRRAAVINASLAALTSVVMWYTWTMPVGGLRLQILSVGQGSSMVLTTPRGQTWVLNAGSRDLPNVLASAFAPTLRTAGDRRIDGILLMNIDAIHASAAGDVINRYRPAQALTPAVSAPWNFAADMLEHATARALIQQGTVQAGDRLELGAGATAQVLWPVQGAKDAGAVALMLEFAGRRILLLDSSSVQALTLLPLNHIDLHCDAIVLTSPERGAGDDPLRALLPETGASAIIWSGRTPWAPHTQAVGTFNAADGCITLQIDRGGRLTVAPIAAQNSNSF